jgi:hypothetical protein
MKFPVSQGRTRRFAGRQATTLVTFGVLTGGVGLMAQSAPAPLLPGNLVLSRSVYDNHAGNVTVGQVLPPGCAMTSVGCPAGGNAINDGIYPYVFNNDLVDGSFGITARLFLDQLQPDGHRLSTLEVPNNLQGGFKDGDDQLVTSFSSKSEGALNLSTDHKYLTFIDYVAPVNAIDVSNSNTPGVIDPTNPVGIPYYRAAARVDGHGNFSFTKTNAYSGNNGRAAILNNSDGNYVFYTAGNAGNGNNPQPNGVVLGAGAQIFDFAGEPQTEQDPGTPTPVGSFSVTLLGAKADKIGKDDNFRGLTIFNNVLYFTKGSGGNGVNTVYFLDTTGAACPTGVGLPSPSATLPTEPIPYDLGTLPTAGLPSNMCILKGFPSTPNKTATVTAYPFGIWFANATTLYVADEGDNYTGGTDLYTHARAQTTAGLQKWIFDSVSQSWKLAYTLQNGLLLGKPLVIPGYPDGINSATGLPWAPATDGLRNITGKVYPDGSAVIWAITSTISGGGDPGADPNRLLRITDLVANTDPAVAANEKYLGLRDAGFGEVLRGISFTPGTD